MADYFPFVQLEFTHALGPEVGRYVVAPPADGEGSALATSSDLKGSADVLLFEVIGGRGASEGGIIRRRTRTARPGGAAAVVPIALVTFVRATQALGDERAAQQLLRTIDESEDLQKQWVGDAVRTVNDAVRAYRLAAMDPYVVEVTLSDPRGVRIGYGKAAQVYKGTWSAAIIPPAPRGARLTRTEKLRPTESVAAVLSRRVFMLASEDIALRALLDVEQGRSRAGAVQAAAAVDLLFSETAAEEPPGPVAERLEELGSRRSAIAELRRSALEDSLDVDALGEQVAELCQDIATIGTAWRYELLQSPPA
ncbi:MAG: hypothetical protein H0U42_05295 [Thermoleophilaceae bacterium]|nr:hypothetical protein [Thermoleophilaceae bacterium]